MSRCSAPLSQDDAESKTTRGSMATRKQAKKMRGKADVRKSRQQGRKAAKKSAKKPAVAKPSARPTATACREPSSKPWGRGGQGARRRAHPRFHARAVGADLHAAARLHGRRRDQGRTARRRRHHARPTARRERRRQPLFHDAQRQQALDHDRLQASEGQGNPRSAGRSSATCWWRISRRARSTAWGSPGSTSTSSTRA